MQPETCRATRNLPFTPPDLLTSSYSDVGIRLGLVSKEWENTATKERPQKCKSLLTWRRTSCWRWRNAANGSKRCVSIYFRQWAILVVYQKGIVTGNKSEPPARHRHAHILKSAEAWPNRPANRPKGLTAFAFFLFGQPRQQTREDPTAREISCHEALTRHKELCEGFVLGPWITCKLGCLD